MHCKRSAIALQTHRDRIANASRLHCKRSVIAMQTQNGRKAKRDYISKQSAITSQSNARLHRKAKRDYIANANRPLCKRKYSKSKLFCTDLEIRLQFATRLFGQKGSRGCVNIVVCVDVVDVGVGAGGIWASGVWGGVVRGVDCVCGVLTDSGAVVVNTNVRAAAATAGHAATAIAIAGAVVNAGAAADIAAAVVGYV
jgi:RNase P subunit RPR2